MENVNDCERENSLSHDSAKRFYFAKQRQTKKKYRVTQPLKQPQRNNENTLEAVLGTITGGHSDNQQKSFERHTEKAARITPADKPEEFSRQRQMQKAMYLAVCFHGCLRTVKRCLTRTASHIRQSNWTVLMLSRGMSMLSAISTMRSSLKCWRLSHSLKAIPVRSITST